MGALADEADVEAPERLPSTSDARYAIFDELVEARKEARRRIREKPGFFASLSPEARAAILRYDDPEILGPPRER